MATTPTETDIQAAAERFPAGETVTILTPGTKTDPFSGKEVPDPAHPVEVDFPFCAVGMGPSDESWLVGRDLTKVALVVYMPYHNAGITSEDRARVRGVEYEVYGEPFDWQSPFDPEAPGGVEVALRITEG
jgi:hypothetical protein